MDVTLSARAIELIQAAMKECHLEWIKFGTVRVDINAGRPEVLRAEIVVRAKSNRT